MGRPLQPLQPLQKVQLQPPFGTSVDSLCHPCITTTNLSYRFPIFETSATALCGTTGYIYIYIIEGSFELKLPTIWTDEKAEVGRVREEKRRRKKIKKRKSHKKEDEGAGKGRKVAKRGVVFVQCFVAPEGRKVRVGSLKRRVRSHLGRWEMNNCTPLWREAHLEVKRLKTHHVQSTFASWDDEKVHALMMRSTCRSQKAQKHTMLGTLLKDEMFKKCTPLWREAHLQVKMVKTLRVRATFGRSDVEKVDAVVARSTFRSQNSESTTCLRLFWAIGCGKSERRCGAKHISKSKW